MSEDPAMQGMTIRNNVHVPVCPFSWCDGALIRKETPQGAYLRCVRCDNKVKITFRIVKDSKCLDAT